MKRFPMLAPISTIIEKPELEELALKKLANVASRSSINVLSRYSKLAASLDVDTRRRKQIP